MPLRTYLDEVAVGYARTSIHSPGHDLLADAANQLQPLLPGGLLVEGSGGKGIATFTPWIGIFDPDETESPQEGIYLVYIYSADLQRVVLTLNQGVTRLRNAHGDKAARIKLAADAAAVRSGLGVEVSGTLAEISFGVPRGLQLAYEAGNIAAVEYSTGALPADATLRGDLLRFVGIYQSAVAAKRLLLQDQPGTISSASAPKTTTEEDPLREFAPKSDSDYVSQLSGKALVKTRRHEALLRSYGEHAKTLGLAPATNVHPRDLTLQRHGSEWLVEAKVVYRGNSTNAVRDAIGQLLQYRHFWYPAGSSIQLVGLFTEPIGAAYVDLLDALEIRSVWKSEAGWTGGTSAVADGLV